MESNSPYTQPWGLSQVGKGPPLGPTMLDPNDPGVRDEYPRKWRDKAEKANAQFLAAMRRAA